MALVAASLPSFLSPYLGRILAVALRPAAVAAPGSGGGGGSAAAGSKQAADRVLSLVAAGVEPRLLVPAVCGAYAGCVENVQADEERVVVAARSVARLLAYVQEVRCTNALREEAITKPGLLVYLAVFILRKSHLLAIYLSRLVEYAWLCLVRSGCATFFPLALFPF